MAMSSTHGTGSRPLRRFLIAGAAAVLVVGGAGVAVLASRLPATYSMASMGYPDYGGGPAPASGHDHGAHAPADAVSIETLRGPADGRAPDVRLDLTARAGQATMPDGRRIDGYTLNGSTPGPTIVARQGDLVEVRLTNDNVPAGVTAHWHGLDVPNAEDGVAGVTQDAVAPGQSHTYRFVAHQVGTYWYHSHQASHPQVLGGLLGALVVVPPAASGSPVPARPVSDAAGRLSTSDAGAHLDAVALVHFYGGVRTINGHPGETRLDAAPGQTARVRIINTDNNHMPVWVSGGSYRLLAVDGQDVSGPTPVTGRALTITAGARADLEVTAPASGGVRIQVANASIVVGQGVAPTSAAPSQFVDLLSYGTPTGPLADPAQADRTFDYAIGRRLGLLNGRPGSWWTINGRMFPDVPMFMVTEGDRVVMRISNTSGEPHPMHLHGHHVTVLSRNGVAASGSPWVVDSLHVEDGATYLVAFTADNPGIWMDHCHNLPHASEGLMTHLAYVGYSTPFLIGGTHANHPE